MTRFVLLAATCLLAFSARAQTYFNRRYGHPTGTQQEFFFGYVVPRDSGFTVLGLADEYPTPGNIALSLEFMDSVGNVVRTHYYVNVDGGTNGLKALPDGGYILTPHSVTRTPPYYGVTELWRLTATGDTLWTRRWQRGWGEAVQDVAALPDGGFAIAGSIAPPQSPATSGQGDFILTRTDSAGNLLWWRTYDNRFQDDAFSLAVCQDGGFLLSGHSLGGGQYDAFVVKTDSLGAEQWRRTFGSPTLDDGAYAVAALRDGSYLVASAEGTRTTGVSNFRRHVVRRLNPDGTTRWTRRPGPETESNEIYAIHELADGSLVLAGQQDRSDGLLMPQGVIFKLCGDGDSVWTRTVRLLNGPNSRNYLRGLCPTPDGGWLGTGFLHARPPDTGTATTAWAFRLDSAGFVVGGGAVPTRSCRPVGLPAAPTQATGVLLWPNPAGASATLRRPPSNQPATLMLHDALGRPVRRWPLPANTTDAPLDLRGLVPGVYGWRLEQVGRPAARGKLLVQP